MTQPATKPHRPVYPPPTPKGFTDPGGTTPVEHALRVQTAVHQQYSDWRAAHPAGIDPQVLKDNAGVFAYSDPAYALSPAIQAVKDDAAAAQAKADNLASGQAVGNDVEARLAAQSFWHRKERVLDSITQTPKWLRRCRI